MRRLLAIFGSAFVIGFTGAVAPGPLLALCVHQTLTAGFWSGMLTVAGHAAAELILVIALAAGCARFLTTRPGLFRRIRVAGGAVLAALGVMMIVLAPPSAADTASAVQAEPSLLRPVLLGAFVSVGNPYFALWWATVGLGLLGDASRAGRIGEATFYVGHQLSDVVWYAFVAGSIALGRTALLGTTAYRVLLIASGVCMIGFGIYFIVRRKPTG